MKLFAGGLQTGIHISITSFDHGSVTDYSMHAGSVAGAVPPPCVEVLDRCSQAGTIQDMPLRPRLCNCVRGISMQIPQPFALRFCNGQFLGVVAAINVQSNSDLVQIARAFGTIRLLLGPAQRRQKHGRKYCYDCDDYQQFDQRERERTTSLLTTPKSAIRRQSYRAHAAQSRPMPPK